MTGLKNSRRILLAVILVVPGFTLATRAAFNGGGGGVLPAWATPHGYSLKEMASAIALFSTSGNSALYYPTTPFQILYEDVNTVVGTPVDGGLVVTGSNSFTVDSRKQFFVAIAYFDDSPPVEGNFPADASEAVGYVFGQQQIGTSAIEIIVDGQSTSIGPNYVAGPVLTASLLDGGGRHFISLGAFLSPLAVGTHTVTMKATESGDAIVASGLDFVSAVFTYTIKVVPGH